MSDWSLYGHALYFIVNTVSHVAIGDITAVNSHERVFVAVLILFGTFIYSFLFGNIVSIVSDMGPSEQVSFFEKYEYVTERIGAMDDSEEKTELLRRVDEYFDFIYSSNQGHDCEADNITVAHDNCLKDLPSCIRSDLVLWKYQEAI